MSEYILPPVEVDPELLLEEAYSDLADAIPGWVPADGHVEAWLLEVVVRMIAENRELASAILTTIYKHWGTDMVNVPPIEATQAEGTSTWTAINDDGYLIEEGLTVGIRNDLGQLIAFEVRDEVTIAPGDTVTAAGEVVLVAVDPGEAGSGLTGETALIDTRTWVDSIALVGQTTGGVDAETDDEYLVRLTEELQLLTRSPILPDDFAVIYRRIASVARALAFDGYDPGDESEDNERMVTVVGVDEDGAALSGGTKTAGEELLESLREVTFEVHIIDPTYTTVDVAFTATAYSGFDADTVALDAIAALESYLSPQNWGLPNFGDAASTTGWVDEPYVRHWEVIEVLNRVDGLHWVDTLTIGAQKLATIEESNDTVTLVAHGYVLNDPVIFRSLTGGTGLTAGTVYFARDIATDTFKVAATAGGAAINVTLDATAATVVSLQAEDVDLPGKASLTLPGNVDGTVLSP